MMHAGKPPLHPSARDVKRSSISIIHKNTELRLLLLWTAIRSFLGFLKKYFLHAWSHNPLSILAQRQRRLYFVENYGEVMIKPRLKERIMDLFLSDYRRRKRLLGWVHERLLHMEVIDFSTCWQDGTVLCALLESICPGVCPSYHLLSQLNWVKNCRLGMKLANKYLYVPMDLLTPEEMAIATRATEHRIIQYISMVKWASENIKDKWSSLHASLIAAKTGRCFAKGCGLRNGIVGKRSKFTVIVSDTIGVFNLLVEVRGPNNEYCGERIISLHQAKGLLDQSLDVTNLYSDSMTYLEDGVGNTFVRRRVPPRHVSDSKPDLLNLDIQCGEEGTFFLTFVPRRAGMHAVAVKWQNHHVDNSPFRVKVYKASNVSTKNLKGAQEKRVIYDSLSFTSNGDGSQDSVDRLDVKGSNYGDTEITENGRSLTAIAKSNAYGKGRQLTVTHRRVLRRIITRHGEDIVIEEAISPTISRQSSMDTSDEDCRYHRKERDGSLSPKISKTQLPVDRNTLSPTTVRHTSAVLGTVVEEKQKQMESLSTAKRAESIDKDVHDSQKASEKLTVNGTQIPKSDVIYDGGGHAHIECNVTGVTSNEGQLDDSKFGRENERQEESKLAGNDDGILLAQAEFQGRPPFQRHPLLKTVSIQNNRKEPARRTQSDGPVFRFQRSFTGSSSVSESTSDTDGVARTDDDGHNSCSSPTLKFIHSGSMKKACMYISDKAFSRTFSSTADEESIQDVLPDMSDNRKKTKLRATRSLPIMRKMWQRESHTEQMGSLSGLLKCLKKMKSQEKDLWFGDSVSLDRDSKTTSKMSSIDLAGSESSECIKGGPDEMKGSQGEGEGRNGHNETLNGSRTAQLDDITEMSYSSDTSGSIDNAKPNAGEKVDADASDVINKTPVHVELFNNTDERMTASFAEMKPDNIERQLAEFQGKEEDDHMNGHDFGQVTDMEASDQRPISMVTQALFSSRGNLTRQTPVCNQKSSGDSSSDKSKSKSFGSSISLDQASLNAASNRSHPASTDRYEVSPIPEQYQAHSDSEQYQSNSIAGNRKSVFEKNNSFKSLFIQTNKGVEPDYRRNEVLIVVPTAKIDKSTQVCDTEIKIETGWDIIEGMYFLFQRISFKVPSCFISEPNANQAKTTQIVIRKKDNSITEETVKETKPVVVLNNTTNNTTHTSNSLNTLNVPIEDPKDEADAMRRERQKETNNTIEAPKDEADAMRRNHRTETSSANARMGRVASNVDAWLNRNTRHNELVDRRNNTLNEASPRHELVRARQLTMDTIDSGFDDIPHTYNRNARYSLPLLRSANGHVRVHRRPYQGPLIPLDASLVKSTSSQSISLEGRELGNEADDELLSAGGAAEDINITRNQRRRHKLQYREESFSMSDSELSQMKKKATRKRNYAKRKELSHDVSETHDTPVYQKGRRHKDTDDKFRSGMFRRLVHNEAVQIDSLELDGSGNKTDQSDNLTTYRMHIKSPHPPSAWTNRSSTRSMSSMDSNYCGFGVSKSNRIDMLSQLGEFQNLCPTVNEDAAVVTTTTTNSNCEHEADSDPGMTKHGDSELHKHYKQRSRSLDEILHQMETDYTSEDADYDLTTDNSYTADLSQLDMTSHPDFTSDDFDVKNLSDFNTASFDMFASFDTSAKSDQNEVFVDKADEAEKGDTQVDADVENVGPRVRVAGVGIRYGQVGTNNSFQVWVDNPSNDSLSVNVVGPRPHTVTETSVVYTGDNLYEVSYGVTQPGFYRIYVRWGDHNVDNSPYICEVTV